MPEDLDPQLPDAAETAVIKPPEIEEPAVDSRDVLMAEIVKKAEDPTKEDQDLEGYTLYTGIKSSFRDAAEGFGGKPAEIGNALYSYRSAREAVTNMDLSANIADGSDAAELNKAVIAVREFHKQLGMEDYSVDISEQLESEDFKKAEEEYRAKTEKEFAGAAEPGFIEQRMREYRREQSRILIKQKIREDVSRMPDMYAHQRMRPYYELKVTQSELQEKFKSTLPGKTDGTPELFGNGLEIVDLPPRDMTRMEAFELQKCERAIGKTEDDLADISDKKRVGRHTELYRRTRLSSTDSGQEPKNFDDMSPAEQRKIILERNLKFQLQVEASMGQEGLEAYKALTGTEKWVVLSKLVDSESAYRSSYNLLEGSLNSGNSNEISDRYNGLKETCNEAKAVLGEIKVLLAAKKAEITSQEFVDAVQEYKKSGKNFGKVAGLFVERAVRMTQAGLEPYKQSFLQAADRITQSYDSVSDKVAQSVTAVAGELHDKIGLQLESSTPAMKRVNTELKNEVSSFKPILERKRIDVRKKLYDKKSSAQREWERSMGILAADIKTEKGKIGLKLRRKIIPGVAEVFTGKGTLNSSEDDVAYNEEMEKYDKAYREMVNQVDAEVAEKYRKNPDFEFFWKEAEKYVKGVPDIAQEQLESAAEELAPEPVPDEKKTPEEPEDNGKMEKKEVTVLKVEKVKKEKDKKKTGKEKEVEKKGPVLVMNDIAAGYEQYDDIELQQQARKQEADRQKKEEEDYKKWEPDSDEHKILWGDIKKQEEAARRGNISEVKVLEEALQDANKRLNEQLNENADPNKLKGQELTLQYEDLSEQLAELQKKLKEIPTGKDTRDNLRKRDTDERALVLSYRKLLVDKWKIYQNMKRGGLIK